jgi:hypothetical protein
MNLEDETQLTAYLDGELDAAGRHWVEAVVQASPRVARRLRDLAEARDLVESLSRPVPDFDVSEAVLARIASPSRPWAFRVRVARVVSPRWLAVGSSLTAAASLLVSITLLSHLRSEGILKRAGVPIVADLGKRESSRSSPSPTHSMAASSPDAPPRIAAINPRIEIAKEITAPAPVIDDRDQRRFDHQHRLGKLLDNGDVRKFRLVVDKIGRSERQKLERAIHLTNPKIPDRGRITVAPGVVIDPEAPNGALIYALILDETEIRRLESRLLELFGGIDDSSPVSALEVLALTEQAQLSVTDPVGYVTKPPADVQNNGYQAKRDPIDSPPQLDPADGASLPDPLTVVPTRRPRSSQANLKTSPDPGHALRQEVKRGSTVLIWLTPRQLSDPRNH